MCCEYATEFKTRQTGFCTAATDEQQRSWSASCACQHELVICYHVAKLQSRPGSQPKHSMDGLLSGDTQCEQDELADLVDFEASDEEVLSRIEHCVSAFLDELSFGRLQSIQTVQIAKKDCSACVHAP